MASASVVRSPSARRRLSAAAHSRRWSRAARISTALVRLLLVARSAAPKRIVRRAVVESRPRRCSRSQAAVGVGELAGDVLGPVHVDDAVAADRGAEHGEVAAAALLELDVDARAAAAQGADELADQAVPLDGGPCPRPRSAGGGGPG